MDVMIGCGNLNRRDDGVGVLVAQRLQDYFWRNPRPDVRIVEAGTGGMEVLFQAQGAHSLLFVDACVSGSPPGKIFLLQGDELPNRPNPRYSSHDFRWDHAITAGQILFKEEFPREIAVYLIEAGDTSYGRELTPSVFQSAETVCHSILTHLLHRSPDGANADHVPLAQLSN